MSEFQLGPKARAAGFRLASFNSVGSTNNEAAAAATQDDLGDIWFAALQQTAGRGRRGRKWETPHGNLAASLLLRPTADPAVIATLGFVAGVALNRALSDILADAGTITSIEGADGKFEGSTARIALKWPNDVLVDGAKLAGILLEAQTGSTSGQVITIGIGVNIVSAPEGLPYPTTSTSYLGLNVDAPGVFKLLAEHWVDVYALWNNGAGIADVLAIWRQSAAGIGASVAINVDGKIVQGIFDTIDDTGRLIVRTDEGQIVPIAAGDVHFGTTASIK